MQNEGRIRVSAVDWISMLLVVVGALNWGLVGAGMWAGVGMDWNVVAILLGSFPTIEALVYVLVGVAGLYELYFAYQLYGARTGRPETARST